MIWRVVVAFAAFAAAAGFVRTAAADQETLTILRTCPSTGWHRACLPVAFFFTDDGSERLRIKEVEDGSYFPTKVLDYILVKGALPESRGSGVFRLKLDYRVSESEAVSPNELGGFAFVGRSRAGRPIVLTDRGPLEIATPGIDFESPGDLYVVRERDGRLLARVVGGYAMPFVVTKTGEIGVWDSARAVCIAAPGHKTRELTIITTACKRAGVPEDGVVLGGNVAGTNDVSKERATRMVFPLGEEPVEVFVNRAPGTGLLLIRANWQSCC
jgi:hypothetical protein